MYETLQGHFPSLTLGRRVPSAAGAGGHFTPPLLVPGALQHPGVMLSQPQQQGGGSKAPTQPHTSPSVHPTGRNTPELLGCSTVTQHRPGQPL